MGDVSMMMGVDSVPSLSDGRSCTADIGEDAGGEDRGLISEEAVGAALPSVVGCV